MPSIYSSARTELAKLLIYGLFRKIRVLAQDDVEFEVGLWRVDDRICAKRRFDGPPAEVNATTIRNPRGGSDGTRTYLLRQPHDSHNEVGRRVACSSCPKMRTERCLRCLLLVMCTHPFAKKALTPHLARSEGHERYFGCNLMHRKVLASSHQHVMAEAPKFS